MILNHSLNCLKLYQWKGTVTTVLNICSEQEACMNAILKDGVHCASYIEYMYLKK